MSWISDRLQRPRTLTQRLARALVATAFVSVVVVGALNLYGSLNLLDDGTQDVLAGVGSTRVQTIEAGADRLVRQASIFAADFGVATALSDLGTAFDELGTGDTRLDDGQRAELDRYYETEVLAPLDGLGVGPFTVADVEPRSEAGRYVQYHYVLPGLTADGNGSDGNGSDGNASAGEPARGEDDSAYGRALDRVDGEMQAIRDAMGASDLLLVDRQGRIVYTTEKRIDLGIDLAAGGFYAGTRLADTVQVRLPRVPVGEALIADYQLYLPTGAPALFVTARVRQDNEVIGAIAVQVPVDALNRITAADGRWEDVGLRGGEAYIVGGDLVLRSESRIWIEEPDRFLDEADPDRVPLIESVGSPVGVQAVDTEPVRRALDGDVFEGQSRNYFGDETYTYASPIDVSGVSWVVVVDVPLEDVRQPLFDFLRRLLIVLVVVLPVAAVVGVLLARRLTRPIEPVAAASRAVASGARDVEPPITGRDEFGDLARRLGNVSVQLAALEGSRDAVRSHTEQMLRSVLPADVVDGDTVRDAPPTTTTATVVAIAIVAVSEVRDPEAMAELLDEVATSVLGLAEEAGARRIRSAADFHLLVIGGGDDGDGTPSALGLAASVAAGLRTISAREGVEVSARIGLATGPVTTAVQSRGRVSYLAWGRPVGQAMAIALLAPPGTVGMTADVVAGLPADRWAIEDTRIEGTDAAARLADGGA